MSDFAMAYHMKKKMAKGGAACPDCDAGMCMAHGGEVGSRRRNADNTERDVGVHKKLDHTELKPGERSGMSRAGIETREAHRQREYGDSDSMERAKRAEGRAKREHHQVLGELKGMKKPHLYAEGGDVMDPVSRIMAKRKGEPLADFEPADYDEMDQLSAGPEADYTAENSGDELGMDEMEGGDMVSRIMKKRKRSA